jgi:predicted branched-subunit amino acid permease
MEIYGVRLIGVNTHTGEKLIFTLVLIAFFVLLRFLLKALTRLIFSRYQETRIRFWSRQGIDVGTTILFVVGLISIWFDNPANLATGVGLGSAGLAFALQKVITSLAGYLVILHLDGWRSRRRHRTRFYPDHHHGDGTASLGTKRGACSMGLRSTIHRTRRNGYQQQNL